MNFKRKPGLIGIDIGSHNVKAAQVRRCAHGYEVVEAAIVARLHPWQFESWHESMPQSSVGEILAARSIGDRFIGKASASTLSMALFDNRAMRIEHSTDELLNRQQIEAEMEQLDRFDMSQREFDYWPIKRKWRIAGANVAVMSLPSGWARQAANDQVEAGFQLRAIDGLPVSLARAATMTNFIQPGEPVAMVDWGYTRATFCLVVDGSPVFVRMLRGSGFSKVIHAVCRRLEVTPIQAAKLLCETGLENVLANNKTNDDQSSSGKNSVVKNSELQHVLTEAVAEPLKSFASELTRTLDYLKTQSDSHPRQVVLSGGGSTIANVGIALQHETKLTTRPWALDGSNATAGRDHQVGPHATFPISMFASAIALSALAWSPMEATL